MDGIAQMLGRCATAMPSGISVQAVLDHFVGELVDVLEVDGAGAVVLSNVAAPEYLAASDAAALGYERLQSVLGQGPCVLAQHSALAVCIPDLASDEEFPEFTAAARGLGLAAAFAFPLLQGEVSLGSLDLYRMSPGRLGEAEMHAAQMLADVLASYVTKAQDHAALASVAEREHSTAGRLRALVDERNDFVSTLIHELGNPLVSIAGFTELLAKDAADLSDRQRRYVSGIRRNSDRLQALATDLLTVVRLGPDGMHGAYADVDLRAVVAAVREVLVSAPEAPALDVVFVVPDWPVVVHGHRVDLERMVSNLLGNAVKYTPPGGTVTCALSEQDGHASLEVRDTGIGIPLEEQGDLFAKFFRASTATQRGIPGTGLGLAIVKAVVESHAGTVDLSSGAGTGTRVAVRLPATRGISAHG